MLVAVALVLVAAGGVAAYLLSQRSQDTRSQAAGDITDVLEVYTAQPSSLKIGDTGSIKFYLNTNGAQIDSLQLSFRIENGLENPAFVPNKIAELPHHTGNPLVAQFTENGERLHYGKIGYLLSNFEKPFSGQDVYLGELTFTAGQSPKYMINWDMSDTKATLYGTGDDALRPPAQISIAQIMDNPPQVTAAPVAPVAGSVIGGSYLNDGSGFIRVYYSVPNAKSDDWIAIYSDVSKNHSDYIDWRWLDNSKTSNPPSAVPDAASFTIETNFKKHFEDTTKIGNVLNVRYFTRDTSKEDFPWRSVFANNVYIVDDGNLPVSSPVQPQPYLPTCSLACGENEECLIVNAQSSVSQQVYEVDQPRPDVWQITQEQVCAPKASLTDLNKDGTVNALDLSAVIDRMVTGGSGLEGDLNRDGRVDTTDYSLMLRRILLQFRAAWAISVDDLPPIPRDSDWPNKGIDECQVVSVDGYMATYCNKGGTFPGEPITSPGTPGIPKYDGTFMQYDGSSTDLPLQMQ